MSESLQAAIEAAPKTVTLQFGRPGGATVITLATYGAACLTRDVVRKSNQFVANLKAKKAAKQTAQTTA